MDVPSELLRPLVFGQTNRHDWGLSQKWILLRTLFRWELLGVWLSYRDFNLSINLMLLRLQLELLLSDVPRWVHIGRIFANRLNWIAFILLLERRLRLWWVWFLNFLSTFSVQYLEFSLFVIDVSLQLPQKGQVFHNFRGKLLIDTAQRLEVLVWNHWLVFIICWRNLEASGAQILFQEGRSTFRAETWFIWNFY